MHRAAQVLKVGSPKLDLTSTNWIGFIAVQTRNVDPAVGRDVVVAWRGTVAVTEWLTGAAAAPTSTDFSVLGLMVDEAIPSRSRVKQLMESLDASCDAYAAALFILPSSPCDALLKRTAYAWSYLVCRIGRFIPVWQSCIGSSFR
jgi:hypothetical protein